MLSSKPTSKHRIFPFPLAGFSLSAFSCLAPALRPKFRLHPACANEPLVKGSAELSPDKKLQRALPATLPRLWKHGLTHKQPLPTNLNIKLQLGGCSWHREVWQDWQGWRGATKCHQTLSTPVGPGASLGKAAKEAREHHGCNSVASDSVRDPEMSGVNLWRVVKNSSWKQGKQQGKNSGSKCWSITEPYAILQR